MNRETKKPVLEKWIQTLLDNKVVKPDNVSDFKASLLKGMLEKDQEKIQSACDELSKAGERILKSEIEKFKAAPTAFTVPEKTVFEEEIDEFLQTQGESENTKLRQEMISKLKSGDKEPLIEYIEEELPRKKVLKFRDFIQNFKIPADDLIFKSSQPSQETRQNIIPYEEDISTEEKPKPCNELTKAQSSIRNDVEEAKLSDSMIEGTTENDILQKIRSIPEGERKIWILYETYEDTSSEYRMKKIKFQEQECENFISSLKDKKVLVRGYYGGYKRCLRLAEQFLGQKFSDMKENFAPVRNQAIIALSNGEKACLLFITEDGFFDFQRKADSTALAINYIRILVDLSQVICIAPDENFLLNPDNQNPYIDKPNPGFNIKGERIEPSDKVSIIQVPILPTRKELIQDFDFSKFVLSPDFTKNLVKAQVKIQHESERKCQQIHEAQSFLGHVHASDIKDLNYLQLKQALLGNWGYFRSFFKPNSKPRAIESCLLSMLLKFIPMQKKAEFKSQLEILSSEYLERKDEMTAKFDKNYKALIEESYDLLYQFINENECKRQGLFNNLFGKDIVHYVPHDQCRDYKISQLNKSFKYKKISFKIIESKLGRNQFSFHMPAKTSLESMLSETNDELGQLEMNHVDESSQWITDCQNNFLQKVFNMVDSLILEKNSTSSLEIQFSFYNVSTFRNMKEAENFNITSQPVTLIHRVPDETSPALQVRSLYFLQENSGLILFSDFPPNKSSLYSFNLSNKGDPRAEYIMTLSSSESHLLVEPNFKLWCVYDNKEQRFDMGKLSSIGQPEGGAPLDIFHEMLEGCTIEQILSACFLPLSDSFFILNQESDLFELKYHSKTLSLVLKKENHGDSFVQKSKITPADSNDKYVEIQTTLDGRNIILRSQKSLDIYDLNWNRVHSIKIHGEDFVKFKTFVDADNTF